MPQLACSLPKAVHVNGYMRYRLGRWEFVREHCRSYPGYVKRFTRRHFHARLRALRKRR